MCLRSIEICAGAGGQALGLEVAGFEHVCLIEIDKHACATLRENRPNWDVREMSVCDFSGDEFKGLDLLAGGVPCPPFSIAGKQLGAQDERDLFPEFLRLVKEIKPKAIMIENVKGLLSSKFDDYRRSFLRQLNRLGYFAEWKLLNASDFGVPQLRPRAILVGFQKSIAAHFSWPLGVKKRTKSVGEVLYPYMSEHGWLYAKKWAQQAGSVAPTLVGGSKKHGGPDLGPSRAKQAWLELSVDGRGIAADAPEKNFKGFPRLTVQMAAAVQGFPKNWIFSGAKTAAYRQVGNAFPPPVAFAVGLAIKKVLENNPLDEADELLFEPQQRLSLV